ncbi:hypothetical protein HDV03_003133 [Kappamyces sp. JEL0829]|nr:hypothetical protein HDV03_003133 [Kappamyces sp. JEL0829]
MRFLVLFCCCFSVFIDTLSYSILLSFLPVTVSLWNGKESDVGIILSMYSLGYLFGSLAAGMARKWLSGRKSLMLGFAAIQIGAAVLLSTVEAYWSIVLARILQGLCSGALWVLCLEMLAEAFPQNTIGKVFAAVLLCNSFCNYVGPYIGGILFSKWGYFSSFYLLLVLSSLDGVFRLALLPSDKQAALAKRAGQKDDAAETISLGSDSQEENSQTHSSSVRATLTRLVRNRAYVILILESIGTTLLFGSLQAVMALYAAADPYRLSPESIGLVFIAMGAPEILFGPLSGILFDKFGLKSTLVTGLLICMGPFVALSFGLSLTWLITSLTILGGLSYFAMSSILGEVTLCVSVDDYPIAYSIYNSTYGLGLWIGPVWGTAVYQAVGFRVYSITGAVGCAVLFLLGLIYRRPEAPTI